MDEHGLPIVGAGVDYTKVQLAPTGPARGVLSKLTVCVACMLQVPALEHKKTLCQFVIVLL